MNNDHNNNNRQSQPYEPPPQSYEPPPQLYQQPYYYQQQNYQNGVDPALEGKAVQAIVFGIIGIFFARIVFGIIAITTANYCKRAGYTGDKVTVGFVLGIIDIVLFALGWIPFIAFFYF